MIPSKWVHVDKNEFKERARDYQPKWKSRLVSRGNFEQTEGIRSDSPTGDSDLRMIITAWASVVGTKLHSADVSNAYFHSEPLDRVLLLRQPRGGLPEADPNAALLVRVPVDDLLYSYLPEAKEVMESLLGSFLNQVHRRERTSATAVKLLANRTLRCLSTQRITPERSRKSKWTAARSCQRS